MLNEIGLTAADQGETQKGSPDIIVSMFVPGTRTVSTREGVKLIFSRPDQVGKLYQFLKNEYI